MGTDEQETLARWYGHRDALAFERIVRQHAGPVYATCRRILRNEADAEDLTQECFAALAGAPRGKRPRRAGPWLHAVATNRCLMHIRSEGRRARRDSEYARSQPCADEMRWDDVSTFIDEAIAELSQELRDAVVLHFVYGEPHAGVARALRLPRRTVSHRIQKGVERIGDTLRRRGIVLPGTALAALMASHLGEAITVPSALLTSIGATALANTAASAATVPAGIVSTPGAWLALKVAAAAVAVVALTTGGYVASGRLREGRDDSSMQVPTRATTAQPAPFARNKPDPAKAHEAAASISGTVLLSGANQPVPGVNVSAWNTDTRTTQFETVSDAAGKYAIRGLDPGTRYTLLAIGEEEGYKEVSVQSVTLEAGESNTTTDILVCQSSISGVVLDKSVTNNPSAVNAMLGMSQEDGRAVAAAWRRVVGTRDAPLTGIRVRLGQGGAEEGGLGYVFQETTTDDRGQFAFRCVRPGGYVVQADAPDGAVRMAADRSEGSRPVDVGANDAKDGIELSFRFDAVSVSGRVLASDGTPIQDAAVSALPLYLPAPDGGEMPLRTGPVQGVSDEHGAYRLPGLCPAGMREAGSYVRGGPLPPNGETYTIIARAEGYAGRQVVVPAVPERVAREANEYLRIVQTYLERTGRDDGGRGMVKEYSEVRLPAGSGNAIENIDLVLAREATVFGRVADTHGAVLAKCRIRMSPVPVPDPKPIPLESRAVFPDWVETGPAGEFEFGAVPAGTYTFEAARETGTQRARNAPLDVSEGDAIEAITVVFESADDRGAIAGRVVDATTRQPVTKFAVNVCKQESRDEPTPVPGTLTRDEPNGTFAVKDISPCSATLFAFADGYAPAAVTVDVPAGQETPLTIAVERPGRIEGTMSINGVPAQGRVTARPTTGPGIPNSNGYGYSPFVEAEADESGHFVVDGLPAGEYEVTTNAVTGQANTTFFRHVSAAVFVPSGVAARADLDASGTASLHGTFTFPDKYRRGRVHLIEGNPADALAGDNFEEYRPLMRASTERMRESGPYRFDHLDPGTYTVTAFCYNNRELEGTGQPTDQPRVWKRITLAEGQDVNLDINLEKMGIDPPEFEGPGFDARP